MASCHLLNSALKKPPNSALIQTPKKLNIRFLKLNFRLPIQHVPNLKNPYLRSQNPLFQPSKNPILDTNNTPQNHILTSKLKLNIIQQKERKLTQCKKLKKKPRAYHQFPPNRKAQFYQSNLHFSSNKVSFIFMNYFMDTKLPTWASFN
jgi:hypothetical protein